MIKILFILLFAALRWAFILALVLAAIALLLAIIALPFAVMAGAFGRKSAPPPAELYIAKETTMPAFLSVISYALLVALMLGVALGWIGGL